MVNPSQKMAEKFYLKAKLIVEEPDTECLKCLKCNKKLGKLLEEYENFRSCNSVSKTYIEFMESLAAAFKLLIINSKIIQQKFQLDAANLQKLKQLTIQAYKCKDFPGVLMVVAKALNQVFVERNYYSIARIYMNICLGANRMMPAAVRDKNNFFVVNRIRPFKEPLSCASIIHIEIDYLSRVFLNSTLAIMNDNFETEEHDAQEMVFDDLLKELGLKDEYNNPKLVRSFKQAKELFNLINIKLDMVEMEQKTCEFSLKVKKLESQAIFDHISYHIWRGGVYHNLHKFQKDREEKIKLIEKAIGFYNIVLSEYFKKKEDAINLIDQFENFHLINTYRQVVVENAVCYNHLTEYKMKNLLNASSTCDTIKPWIHEVNILLRDKILFMKSYIRFADEMSCIVEKDKVDFILSIAKSYRQICLNNKKTQEVNLMNSLPYIKRFVLAIKSDPEVFNRYNFLPKYSFFVANFPIYSDEWYVELVKHSIDSNDYIVKFRDY